MALLEKTRGVTRFLPPMRSHRVCGMRTRPEGVVLGVRAGVSPSPQPPVRIFLGTEPAQYRAERVFFWSIEQVRDPSRVYEIYLMKELAGFDRRGWLTGFTNYRFAIPHFAGGSGRAIYNDVDQVYLADPGELFDTDLGGHGYLALSDRDTAVMLIDCAQMAAVWTLEAAQQERRKAMEEKARQVPGLWGKLPPAWHARDVEYMPNSSKLLHYTAIHMQPWQPFPQRYAYQQNPVGQVWFDLERAANAAGYQVFTSARPSAQYTALPAEIRAARTKFLEYLPEEDIPWVTDELFRQAGRLVCSTVSTFARTKVFADRTILRNHTHDESWWLAQFEAASVCHPEIRWKLALQTRSALGQKVVHRHEGGRRLNGPPTVWMLTDNHPGNTTQSLGLVKALGWPYEVKELHFTPLIHLHDGLFGAFGATRLGLNRRGSASLAPPWPDLVITTGWRTEHVARWIKKQSHGRTRVVQMGRKGGRVAEVFDLVVSCTYFRLPPHPRRLEITAPLTRITPEHLAQAAERWQGLFEHAPHPRVVLLVGGDSSLHCLDAETARRMGEQVRAFAQAAGGSVFATTSRRTGQQAAEALQEGLGDSHYLHVWHPGQQDNPYLAYLALADVLVVTGESESMLAEAAATGKPLYIYPLPKRQLSRWTRCKEWVVARAQLQRINERGTVRPQQGLEYLCARLIERGIILPQQDLHVLHQALVQRGIARFFGEPLDTANCPVLQEVDEVAQQVRALMGMSGSQ
jgi:mitochondrial fission protein ELM1